MRYLGLHPELAIDLLPMLLKVIPALFPAGMLRDNRVGYPIVIGWLYARSDGRCHDTNLRREFAGASFERKPELH